ncbi:MAG TPA: hypothetical protein VJT32_14365 [bacterium]|nr:hypothetical protein [bacterium]
MVSRLLAGTFAVLLVWGTARSAEFPLSMAPGANFYGQEEWEPGKLRRWMRDDGELRIQNDGPPVRINLRFVAESFRIPRTLRVRVGREVLVEGVIPTEPLRVVVKDMPVAAGETVVVFSATPGPDQVNRYLNTADAREVSIAFGPVSAIDARTPEAQREEMAAFPAGKRLLPRLSPLENTAANLRRAGRLLEAREAYAAALHADRIDPTTYLWTGLTLIGLDDLEGARAVLMRGRQVGGLGVVAATVRRACAQLADYVDRSVLLAHPDLDPALALRKQGAISRAVAVYRRVLAETPNDLYASYWLGVLTAVAERPREAAPLLAVVSRAVPAGPDAAMVNELQHYLGGR